MKPLLTAALALTPVALLAQESPYSKFGKVSPADLQRKVYSLDSSANAVVLADIGDISVEGNNKGWFSVITTRHKVVHILAKSAYDEADVEVYLSVNGDAEETLVDVKAVTYNLEGGKIVESKLERSNVFTEKRNKNLIVKKFTLPAVKEGSIVEFQYRTASDFIWHVDPWRFQGGAPCLWSELRFSVPQFFSYGFISHGYVKAFVTDKKDRASNFTVRESGGTSATQTYSFNSGITDYRWVMKDVPEMKPESYTSSIENHLSKIEFQLVSQSDPLVPRDFRNTWPAVTKELMESEHFGAGIKGGNGWLSDEVKPLTAGTASQTEKARRIYNHVRDGFTCTDHSAVHTEQSVRNVAKTKKGSVSEINLLLTAMLRNAGIEADPVILSQTHRGYTYELYPMVSRFNYVVTRAHVDGKTVYLDASHDRLGFGRLVPECYNGHARVVDVPATPVYLMSDSVAEKKLTAVFLNKADKGIWQGNFSQTPGYYESYELRKRLKEGGQDAYFKEVQKVYGSETKVSGWQVDSLTRYDDPVTIKYNLQFDARDEDVLYINPMFGEGLQKNPFKSAERMYPVEMPYTRDETYVLTMEVPEGYKVDELPKQIVAKFDEEGNTFFEYRIQLSGNTVSLRSRIKLGRAYYEPGEYEILREFFNMVVKKHNEQIVFKKTN